MDPTVLTTATAATLPTVSIDAQNPQGVPIDPADADTTPATGTGTNQ